MIKVTPRPPAKNTIIASHTSFQRRRYSIPEKADNENTESPWIPIVLPNSVSVDVSRSKNMLQMDTLGTKSTDLVFLEEHDKYLCLKVFNGTKFVYSDMILGTFGIMATIRLADSSEQSQIPAIALASKDEIFIYHRNACIFKRMLDPISLSDIEWDFWNRLAEFANQGQNSEFESVICHIKEVRNAGNLSISYQMQTLLSFPNTTLMQDYVKTSNISPNIRIHVSAIDALPNREMPDGSSPSLIVLGTLECQIYLLSPPRYTVSEIFQLSSAIMQLKSVGSFYGDYKIFSLCMDGCVYLISRNKCEVIIESDTNPIHFVASQNYIFLSYMDSCVRSYNHSGKMGFKISFISPIIHMEAFNVEQKGVYGFMVALQNKDIKIYNGSDKIFEISLPETVSAFAFGSFKGEDMALVSIMKNKNIDVRVLRRNSLFTLQDIENKKLEFGFSKKSKAYVDCLKRERHDAKGIYDRFQRMELLSQVCLDRRQISAYTSMPIQIDLNIELIGIVNPYTVVLRTTNKSITPAAHLFLSIRPLSNAKFTPNIIKIPFLPPHASCCTDGILDCPDAKQLDLSCRILCKGRTQPILSTVISISINEAFPNTKTEQKALAYAHQ